MFHSQLSQRNYQQIKNISSQIKFNRALTEQKEKYLFTTTPKASSLKSSFEKTPTPIYNFKVRLRLKKLKKYKKLTDNKTLTTLPKDLNLSNEQTILDNIYRGTFTHNFLEDLKTIHQKRMYLKMLSNSLNNIYLHTFIGKETSVNFFDNIIIPQLKIPEENFFLPTERNKDYRKTYKQFYSIEKNQFNFYSIHHINCINNDDSINNLVAIEITEHQNVHSIIDKLRVLKKEESKLKIKDDLTRLFNKKRPVNNSFINFLTNMLNANADLSQALELKQKQAQNYERDLEQK